MNNRKQLSGPAGCHKVIHLFLWFREFVEPLDVDHDHGASESNPLALLMETSASSPAFPS
jgi:hypothetical protein